MSGHWDADNGIYTGRGGVICPKCGHERISIFDHAKISDKFMFICWKCNTIFGLDTLNIIDPNITSAVSLLNRKGYKTKFSCEGHPEDTEKGGTAYIYFANSSLKQIIKDHPLPTPWFLGDRGGDIYCFIIRAHEWLCPKEDWDERCERITEWAESLPVISDDITFKYGYPHKYE